MRFLQTIGKKIALSFGILILFFCVVGLATFAGIANIFQDARTVIQGNQFKELIAQEELKQLGWVNTVSGFLNQTNDTASSSRILPAELKVRLGEWLHSWSISRRSCSRRLKSTDRIISIEA